MSPPLQAIFIHDTRRIISANADALTMFRCEEWELKDRPLLDLVPEYLQDLTRINLYTTLKGRGTLIKSRQYDFIRCDGTLFSAEVTSRQLDNGQFETTVTFRYNVK